MVLDSSGGGSGGGNGILGKMSEFSVMMLHNGAPWRHRKEVMVAHCLELGD